MKLSFSERKVIPVIWKQSANLDWILLKGFIYKTDMVCVDGSVAPQFSTSPMLRSPMTLLVRLSDSPVHAILLQEKKIKSMEQKVDSAFFISHVITTLKSIFSFLLLSLHKYLISSLQEGREYDGSPLVAVCFRRGDTVGVAAP